MVITETEKYRAERMNFVVLITGDESSDANHHKILDADKLLGGGRDADSKKEYHWGKYFSFFFKRERPELNIISSDSGYMYICFPTLFTTRSGIIPKRNWAKIKTLSTSKQFADREYSANTPSICS